MAHKRITKVIRFFICRALTTLPYRIPQGVTTPRCLRPTAVSIVETSPFSSAFTYGYLLRSIRLHRLRWRQRCYYQTLSWIETRGDFTDIRLSEFLNLMRARFFEKKSFYGPCSNFVATLSLSTRTLSYTHKNIICKVFLAMLNPFNYICNVLRNKTY